MGLKRQISCTSASTTPKKDFTHQINVPALRNSMHFLKFAVFVVKTFATSSKVDAILSFSAKLRDFPAGKNHCRRLFFLHSLMGDGLFLEPRELLGSEKPVKLQFTCFEKLIF